MPTKLTSVSIETNIEQYGGTGKFRVNFPKDAFRDVPKVTASLAGLYAIPNGADPSLTIFIEAQNPTREYFDIVVAQNIAEAPKIINVRVSWIAIGS